MFSIRLSTVFFHINYLVQVFTQPLDSHMKNMETSKRTARYMLKVIVRNTIKSLLKDL